MTDFDERAFQLQKGALDCIDCGGRMVYDPARQMLRCPYCGAFKPFDQAAPTLNEYPLDQPRQSAASWRDRPQAVRCPNCQSIMVLTGDSTVETCPICGKKSKVWTQEEVPEAPFSLVPFIITKGEAASVFRKKMRWKLFAPRAFRKAAADGSIRGVYATEWTFCCDALIDYSAVRLMKKETQADGNDEETPNALRWTPVRGSVRHIFEDALSPSNPSMSLSGILPYSQNKIERYRPELIAGYIVKEPEITAEESFGVLKRDLDKKMEELSRSDVCTDASKARLVSVSSRYDDVRVRPTLLPVYVFSQLYRNRVRRVLINGETGKFKGDIPTSPLRVLLCALLVAAILFGALEIFLHTGDRTYLFYQF